MARQQGARGLPAASHEDRARALVLGGALTSRFATLQCVVANKCVTRGSMGWLGHRKAADPERGASR